MVFYISLSDLGLDLCYILGRFWRGFCPAQSGFLEFFVVANILWTFFIAFALYQNIAKQQPLNRIASLEPAMYVLSWGIALVLAIVVWTLGMNPENPDLGWCWIGNEFVSWRLLFLYFLIFLTFTANAVIYCVVMFKHYGLIVESINAVIIVMVIVLDPKECLLVLKLKI
eukprot:gb/GECH01005248.1/.p1 GENE.gb/GECH01005248.1/~~gb/GECH01005248.1/.p1  ORF type:complete len:170 (+),score=18.67 gb/GECH01005248.1/:1-510(+)